MNICRTLRYIVLGGLETTSENTIMGLLELLILIIILGAVFSGPWWGHSRNLGYGPFGGLLGLVILLIILRVFHII